MTGSSSSGELGASEAIGLVFRIATVGLSLASAIMTATATQCRYDATGRPEATVSYSDYASFRSMIGRRSKMQLSLNNVANQMP